MRDPEFRLPPPRPERGRLLWVGGSVLLHAVVGVALVSVAGPTFVPRPPPPFVLVEIGELGPREAAMPALAASAAGGDESSRRADRAAELVGERLVPVASTARRDSLIPLDPSDIVVVVSARPRGVAGAGAEETVRTDRIIGPAYGDGRLWVRPFIAQLGVVGPSADAATHYARVDSAIRERMKAYVDTMPRDSFALPPPPKWTTDLGGDTWGIDRNWIYLGDIKLPTALLALLPFPQGNYDQAKAAQELQRMREDIIQAARRAETAEEFRRVVDDLRRRKDAEREAARAAQRDTVVP